MNAKQEIFINIIKNLDRLMVKVPDDTFEEVVGITLEEWQKASYEECCKINGQILAQQATSLTNEFYNEYIKLDK